jgi:hypothetical protein
MAHNLRPFRDYSEHEVVNYFTYSGANESAAVVKTKGAVVTVVAPGFQPFSTGLLGTNPIENIGSVGAAYGNTLSDRWGTVAKVTVASSGDQPLGITLMDVRELDENGEKLAFKPRKAAEMGVVVSGQTVPILTRGVVLYSGVNATAGQVAYLAVGANGSLSAATTLPTNAIKVGTFLGTAVNGVAPLKIQL